MGDYESTIWVTKAIATRLHAGRRRKFIAIDEFEGCSKGDPFYLRHPPLKDSKYAKLALRLFKKSREFDRKLANYKFERALGSSRVLSKIESFNVLDWCHVCFIAASDTDQLLCFAELVDFGYGDQLLLNSFSFTNPNSPGIRYGCGICPPNEDYPHPPSEAYTAGQGEYHPIDEASQKELAVAFQDKVIEQEDLKGDTYHMFKLCDVHSDTCFRMPSFDPSCFTPMLLKEGYAEIALSHINEKEDAGYELATTLFAHCEILVWRASAYYMWCHVVFAAEPRNTSDPWDYFFVEMIDTGSKKFSVKEYHRFNPYDGESRKGCGICPKSIDYPHPRDFHCMMHLPRFSDFGYKG